MTKDQIIQVCQKYEQILIDNEKTKEFSDKNRELSHIKWMVTEIPKYIKFVEKLPKNESGKILKTELS